MAVHPDVELTHLKLFCAFKPGHRNPWRSNEQVIELDVRGLNGTKALDVVEKQKYMLNAGRARQAFSQRPSPPRVQLGAPSRLPLLRPWHRIGSSSRGAPQIAPARATD